MRYLTSLVLLSLALTACKNESDNSSAAQDDVQVLQSESYRFELSTLSMQYGVASVQVHMASLDGSVLPGDAMVSIVPEMDMGSMKHGAPLTPASGELDVSANFSTHIYYLMDGSSDMGWTLHVSYDGETVDFPVSVEGVEKIQLKNSSDMITGMSGSTARQYFVFVQHMGIHGDGDAHLQLYVAAKEAAYSYPGAAAGVILNAETASEFSISSVALSICPVAAAVDCETEESWTALIADEDTAGLYGVEAVIEGYSKTGAFNVRLQVNGNTYTTTGNAYDAEVSPGADGLFDFSEVETMNGM